MRGDPSDRTEWESPISEFYRRRHANYSGTAVRQYGPAQESSTLVRIFFCVFFLLEMSVTSCSILNVPRRPRVENELRFSRRRRFGG